MRALLSVTINPNQLCFVLSFVDFGRNLDIKFGVLVIVWETFFSSANFLFALLTRLDPNIIWE